MVVRSTLPDARTATAVSAVLREIDPSMPTREFWTMESRVDRAVSARRFTLGILAAFGVAALLLAGLGIYGVLAHSVAERTPEIGIRMALGASAGGVVRSVLGRTLALAAMGIVAGALLSLVGGRLVGLAPLRRARHGPGDVRRDGARSSSSSRERRGRCRRSVPRARRGSAP